MGRILPFTNDPHRETRDLMPWLITGRLEPEARVTSVVEPPPSRLKPSVAPSLRRTWATSATVRPLR